MPPVGIFAPDAGESIPQIPAIEEGIGHLKDDRPPMPMGWGEAFVIEALEAVDPAKDVDGFHPFNVGKPCTGQETLFPCTPAE